MDSIPFASTELMAPGRSTDKRPPDPAPASTVDVPVEVVHDEDDHDDRDDFEVFYAGNQERLIRALALTLGDIDLATEAVDEAMARAVQRWDQVRRFDNPSGWVYRVALNWATSVLRRRRVGESVRAVYAARAELTTDGPVDPDTRLAQAVTRLPVRLRSVVVCRFYLDLGVEETARSLGIKPGTVKSRLHRALTTLEGTLREEEDS